MNILISVVKGRLATIFKCCKLINLRRANENEDYLYFVWTWHLTKLFCQVNKSKPCLKLCKQLKQDLDRFGANKSGAIQYHDNESDHLFIM